jgi:hypothetical protein
MKSNIATMITKKKKNCKNDEKKSDEVYELFDYQYWVDKNITEVSKVH